MKTLVIHNSSNIKQAEDKIAEICKIKEFDTVLVLSTGEKASGSQINLGAGSPSASLVRIDSCMGTKLIANKLISQCAPRTHFWVLKNDIPEAVIHSFRNLQCKNKDYLVNFFEHESHAIFINQEASSKAPSKIGPSLLESGIIGKHPLLLRAIREAEVLSRYNNPILLCGETGTGKELLARYIHKIGPRQRADFVALNCAAIPTGLCESILFGHTRGAFSGAIKSQKGKFEQAHGGILFLDEITELSLKDQAKLLRVLEDGIVDPIGSKEAKRVNVRVLAATNKSSKELQDPKIFRQDLYYRLRLGEIIIPPLRTRKSDIPALADHIVKEFNNKHNKKRILDTSAMNYLSSMLWPGNIRELRGFLQRALIRASTEIISRFDLDELELPQGSVNTSPEAVLPEIKEGFDMLAYIKTVRVALIEKALKFSHNNQAKAGRLLSISPQAIHRYKTGPKRSKAQP